MITLQEALKWADTWGRPFSNGEIDDAEVLYVLATEIRRLTVERLPHAIPFRDGILSEEWLNAVERGDCTTTDRRALISHLRYLAAQLAAVHMREAGRE